MLTKKTEKLESFIGINSVFTGELNIKGTLRVDGSVNGHINAECVVLCETAVIKGDITATKIIVGGKVEGNLIAKEIVEIKSKGELLGGICTNRFSVIEGGRFNGKIQMKMDESKVLSFESKTRDTEAK